MLWKEKKLKVAGPVKYPIRDQTKRENNIVIIPKRREKGTVFDLL